MDRYKNGYKEYYIKNRDRILAYNREYYRKNKHKKGAYDKKYVASAEVKKTRVEQAYFRLYGITLEEKNSMVDKQEYKCALCKSRFKNTRDQHLDHCHQTNRIRGILCRYCNIMLGYYEKALKLPIEEYLHGR